MQSVELEAGSTLLSHSLWCGQQAIDDNASDSLVLAALLHDIGHLLLTGDEELSVYERDCEHAEVGARWLSSWFEQAVTEPVRLHVEAKRYLFTCDSAYQESLVGASRTSMQNQGGVMNETEIAAFESNPFYKDAIRLRRYDDMPRGSDTLPDFSDFQPYFDLSCKE